jgi:phospholipid/cholesterol/gamma-HCH transport system permease protein
MLLRVASFSASAMMARSNCLQTPTMKTPASTDSIGFPLSLVQGLGRASLALVQSLGALAVFLVEAIGCTLFRLRSLRRVMEYIYEIGLKPTPLIVMVSFFTGMVLALQAYLSLVKFGSEALVGSLVALSVVREIGPVLTAVMVVGQAGSSLTAEIGVQRNSEQLDALQVMGIRPLGYVVGPRILAAIVAYPLLTTIFNVVAIWGGAFSAINLLGMDAGIFWSNLRVGLNPADVWDTNLKALIFGVLTVLVCTFEGFYTHTRAKSRGARGVSESATRAVVISSVTILFFNYLLTSLIIG